MAREEDDLARLEADRVDFDASVAARHARYAAEDVETAARRAREDDLHAQGAVVREDMKTALEAAIAKRKAEEAAKSPDTISGLMARIKSLEVAADKQPVVEEHPAVVAAVKPTV